LNKGGNTESTISPLNQIFGLRVFIFLIKEAKEMKESEQEGKQQNMIILCL